MQQIQNKFSPLSWQLVSARFRLEVSTFVVHGVNLDSGLDLHCSVPPVEACS